MGQGSAKLYRAGRGGVCANCGKPKNAHVGRGVDGLACVVVVTRTVSRSAMVVPRTVTVTARPVIDLEGV